MNFQSIYDKIIEYQTYFLNSEQQCMCCGNDNAISRGFADGTEQFYCDKCHRGELVKTEVDLIFMQYDAVCMETIETQYKIYPNDLYHCVYCFKKVPFYEWNFENEICLVCTWTNHGKNSAGRYTYTYQTSDGYQEIKACPADLSYFEYSTVYLSSDELKNLEEHEDFVNF